MHSLSITIPGTDQPARPAKAAQLAAIKRRASASEAVVDLLCDLAFGPRPEWGWPGALPTSALRSSCETTFLEACG